ncbi:5-methyltetrahydropteroyltriglutamate--homocysteine S-methyltransferase [Paenibacillus sp. JX-17]|uniref:5-methyltetrahydropteroyltriglutamate--homocysteine S-methyltransferase n=1 Tax=Paenibacillus lacisoli TaxID=3064525 RepID=A0ABT9CAI4_9BACL|nr:5-methyltetrahydropteroyltriglutamate--homocysteine S-methyltransferase [Paenibacillus sp. JX-17]MDO7905558.1 5-methyltetrahydropteroyltriglutamate--homocysteine S-methyltransferase [Paenibacillus sp. JX-17]
MKNIISGTRTNVPPFRYDIVGSFLRPDSLKEARAAYDRGECNAAGLQETEDVEIRRLIDIQKALGLKAVSDGEYRRSWWHLDFFLGIEGTVKVNLNINPGRPDPKTRAESFQIVDRISLGNHPMIEHFVRLKELAGHDVLAKMTIPSPALFHFVQSHQVNEVYGDDQELYKDIVKVYREMIAGLYAAGCRYLQLDDTSWGTLCSGRHRALLRGRGQDPDQLAADYVKLINESIAGKPSDMTIALHVCRGNYVSTWFAAGGYEPVAETLFAQCRVDAFFLEYDSERSGGFEPLRHIKDQRVVLGLVTTKHGGLESKEVLKARIAEASEYVDLNQLCLSPQCGFASTEEGNLITEEEQWDKIRLVIDTANEIWTEPE